MRPARFAGLALFAAALAGALAAGGANADGRFGDSTWVAPGEPFDSEMAPDGPRVASRDHERRWETVLRTPFRIAFYPLRLMAGGLEAAAGHFGPGLVKPKTPGPPKAGPVLTPHLNYGSVTDIGVGPAITWIGFPTAGDKLHLAGSWSSIDRRRAQFSETIGDRRRVSFRLRGDYDYKPNRHYYGIGNDTPEADLSYYRLESTGAEAALLLGASPLRQLRLVGGYSSMGPSPGYHGSPRLEEVFEPADVPFEHRATKELWYGVSADFARLDDVRDPSSGYHGRIDLSRAAGFSSADPDYYQWRMEGRAYVPVFAKRRVIAVRGVYAGIEPEGGSATILPYYRLALSEGSYRFAGYSSGRFRDRQLMLARIEYRWEIIDRVSALALYELGEVAPAVAAFSLRGTHMSFGGGLRLGMSDERTVRFEIAKGREGLHAALVLGRDF